MTEKIEEKSFGIIPLKKQQDTWLVFIVKIKSGNHFGYPKGKPNIGETPFISAERELKEETNLNIKKYLFQKPLTEEYEFIKNSKKISKQVFYFLAEVEGEANIDTSEVIEGMWIDIKLANHFITYSESKNITNQVIEFLKI